MKIVAVSQRVGDYSTHCEIRDMLDQRLIEWIYACGFMPYPVPNLLIDMHALNSWLEALRPVGIILSGGNDLGQSGSRDRTENALLNYAQRNSLPLLGICRGMQMMGAWAQTELKSVEGHVACRHSVNGEIVGSVNSYHRYSLVACPLGFRIIAKSEDGEIEAIKHLTLPWEGWMWHPERESIFSREHLLRFQNLFGSE